MILAEPISSALLKTLTQDKIPTQSMCPDNYKEIENLKIQVGHIRNDLIPNITEKLPIHHSSNGVDNLIVQYCNTNEEVKKIAKSVADNVKNCLNDNLEAEKLEELQTHAINNICTGVKAM